MEAVNFAIVGCGRIAQRHAKIIAETARLVAVCDVKFGKAMDIMRQYPSAAAYSSIGQMLSAESTIDVVVVCTPNGLHAQHTIEFLKAGKHVICEKPMALRSSDCWKMIDAEAVSGKKVFVVKQNRFNPPVVALRQAIDKGLLGRVVSIHVNCFWNRPNSYYSESDWKGTIDLDGGTLYTQFSHFVDLMVWLFGDVQKVRGFAGNYLHKSIGFEDAGVAALEFNSGAIGSINYTVNSYGKNMEGSLTVFGEKGTVKIGGQYLNTLEYQNIEGCKLECEESAPPNDYGFYQGSMSNHDKVYQNVFAVLSCGESNSTSSVEGLKTVRLIEQIYSCS
jgi:UDP-N-acetyl-2-amino-2-deoxyglucuronate dehydrogenase